MIKKVFLTSLVLLGLVLSQMSIECFAEEMTTFEQAKQNAFSLIDKGDYAKAEEAINRLVADNQGRSDLPETLYWLGVRYEWSGRPEETKRIYQQVINTYPGNIWAQRAKLGIARTNAISLVLLQNYDGAKQAVDRMITDFSGHPDLPEALYWIVFRYEWQNKYDEAKNICQQIIEKYPDSPYIDKAKLGVLRADAMSSIIMQNYTGAKETIDKMTNDFAGNPDLPEALFLVAERYEWINWFAESKEIYQQVIKSYSDNQIISKAKLGSSMSDVRALIISQDYIKAEDLLNKTVVDFNGHPDLPKAIILAGEQFYKEGLAKESNGLDVQAKDSFERALKIWDGFINGFTNSGLMPEACSWAGECNLKMGKYEDSLRCFQKVVDNYPEYEYAWNAQFFIGSTYQRMREAGLMSKSEADSKTKASYQKVISKWPKCNVAAIAQTWLNGPDTK